MLSIANEAEGRKQIESKISGSLLRSSPAQFTKEINEEAPVWKELFTSMNLKPE
jgi:hypothetical protein